LKEANSPKDPRFSINNKSLTSTSFARKTTSKKSSHVHSKDCLLTPLTDDRNSKSSREEAIFA
jgi:hypothetical protein